MSTGWAATDPIPGIVRAIESKCGKRYSVDGDGAPSRAHMPQLEVAALSSRGRLYRS